MNVLACRYFLLALLAFAVSGCARIPSKCQEEIEMLLWEISIQPSNATHSEASDALRRDMQSRVRQCPQALRHGVTQRWFGVVDFDVWYSPIALAALTNDKELVIDLLAGDEDWLWRIERAKPDIAPPLHVAAFEADPDVISALVAYGFSPNEPDVNDLRPLNHAISGLRRLENVAALLGLGAEACPEGPIEIAPLMSTVILNEIGAARALLEECRVGAVPLESVATLIDRAIQRGHFELAEILETALMSDCDTAEEQAPESLSLE